MNDCTKDFLKLCLAKKDVAIFSDCTDGSAELADYNYRDELANFKHLIEGKNWTLTCKNLTVSGNSYTTLLEEEINDYSGSKMGDYKFEIESNQIC